MTDETIAWDVLPSQPLSPEEWPDQYDVLRSGFLE
jgi:hypothetical protein